jgi:hypothetical protein
MFNKSKKLSKNYAIDFSCFHFVRSPRDGITFLEPKINLDLYKGDHNPKLEISLIVLNFKIFEINIYNVNHVKDMAM